MWHLTDTPLAPCQLYGLIGTAVLFPPPSYGGDSTAHAQSFQNRTKKLPDRTREDEVYAYCVVEEGLLSSKSWICADYELERWVPLMLHTGRQSLSAVPAISWASRWNFPDHGLSNRVDAMRLQTCLMEPNRWARPQSRRVEFIQGLICKVETI